MIITLVHRLEEECVAWSSTTQLVRYNYHLVHALGGEYAPWCSAWYAVLAKVVSILGGECSPWCSMDCLYHSIIITCHVSLERVI